MEMTHVGLGPVRSDRYAPRSSGPYERSSGYRPRESRPRKLEDVFETVEMLTFEQFSRYAEVDNTDNINGAGAAGGGYAEYVQRHRRIALERFFAAHKGEAWFIEQYDPFRTESFVAGVLEAAEQRASEFLEAVKTGKFSELALEDGDDLQVESEKVPEGAARLRTFPASMKLPARLHGTTSKRGIVISLSNISPQVFRVELEQLLRECSGNNLLALELGLPMIEKSNYRLGWALFEEGVDTSAIVAAIEEKILHGEKIYCSAQKSFSLQIRIADAVFGTEGRISKDLTQARALMEALDSAIGLNSSALSLTALSGIPEKMQLDLILVYLRRVHFVCYYGGVVAQGANDLTRLAGDLYVRSPGGAEAGITTNVAEAELEHFDRLMADLIDRVSFKGEPITEDVMLEKHVAKVDEGRYRCVHCSKLFKAPDFVIKHLRLKHEDIAKAGTLDTAMINALLARPVLCALLPLPLTRRRSDAFIDRQPRETRDYRSSRDSRVRRPPPPPKDAPHDPRRIRQYVDWDAPAAGDMEISYD